MIGPVEADEMGRPREVLRPSSGYVTECFSTVTSPDPSGDHVIDDPMALSCRPERQLATVCSIIELVSRTRSASPGPGSSLFEGWPK